MEKTNPAYVKDYPEWKVVLWGAVRAFVASFIPTFGFMLSSVTVENFESKETLIKLGISVGLSSLVAGIVGLGKFLRNVFPDSEVLQKLPF